MLQHNTNNLIVYGIEKVQGYQLYYTLGITQSSKAFLKLVDKDGFDISVQSS